jgi:hypothetical protein
MYCALSCVRVNLLETRNSSEIVVAVFSQAGTMNRAPTDQYPQASNHQEHRPTRVPEIASWSASSP